MARKIDAVLPEWSKKVQSFRQRLKLSQTEFSRRLGTSAMSASRWERGLLEPSEGAYIKLGNLAGDPCVGIFGDVLGLAPQT
jgi:DNA-binding transcriptional regulator YiaG